MLSRVEHTRLGRAGAGLAAAWAAIYLGLCLWALPGEDRVAGWFVGLVGIATILCLVALVGFRPRPLLLTAAVVLLACALLGALSVGLGFVPAAALALVAGLASRPTVSVERKDGGHDDI